jgi:hypothetical protein
MPRVSDINITNGEIAYSNFSGRPTVYKPEGGNRTVTFVIPNDVAMDYQEAGWKIRRQEFPNDPDREPRYLLEATLTFRMKNGQPRDPKIFIVRPDSLVHVTEETVDALDRAEIISADAVIGPFYWEHGNKRGIKAYINSLYITIKENPIDEKYRKYIDQLNESILPTDTSNDLPFPIE